MSDFSLFARRIHDRFAEMSQHELFIVGDDNRVFEQIYLNAFPEGSNPIYKTRREYDCSCCKQSIRNIGNVVAIINGELQTVWDINPAGIPSHLAQVAYTMDIEVRRFPITDLFRPALKVFGNEVTWQLVDDKVINWNHLYAHVSSNHIARDHDKVRGDYRTSVTTFNRALTTLALESAETVLSLIDNNTLYRGQEFRKAVAGFIDTKKRWDALQNDHQRHLFLWANATSPVSFFRNSVIGTLVDGLSTGEELEDAVRMYESKVAPTNYKRPTALITPSMVRDANTTVETLGLTEALKRRFANIGDVSINNVIWADNSVKPLMRGGLESLLADSTVMKVPDNLDKAKDISIADFMTTVVPSANKMEIAFTGNHLNNLVSLIAPVYADAGKLFKWNNAFSWSYNGNITDSIKERVKAAGGNVTNAKLRVSLSWYNHDDLDLHAFEPNGNHIYFGSKQSKLDVDMNCGCGTTRTPVENISWAAWLGDGVYGINVHQWSKRETTGPGFVVEVENQGKITQMSYRKPVGNKDTIGVCKIHILNEQVVKIEMNDQMVAKGLSQEKWGINTETFVKVNTLMFSPNFWDGQTIGNQHWFFMIDGCKNPDEARGMYNEFLTPELDKHRKVFELLGDKTKCLPSDSQLSGLGFSSTKQDEVTIRVTRDKRVELFNVKF